jgi:hypothetical protein
MEHTMKNADFSRTSHHFHRDQPSLLTRLVRRGFASLLARAPRSSLAAFGSAFMALVFARRLMVPVTPSPAKRSAEQSPSGRVFEGEFRRIRESR